MPEAQQPSIIVIVAEDCGYGNLSCTGHTDYAAPVLNPLVADSMRFVQAFANASLCDTTRVALMTGRYQYRLKPGLLEPLHAGRHGLRDMESPLDFSTLPALLCGAEY